MVSILLLPLTLLFCMLSAIRRKFYQTGLKKAWKSPVPVIVVGNISVGGTGKTPVVLALVEYLKSAGYTPGVVSRGYGGANQVTPLMLDSDTSAHIAGDEPVLIHRRTGAPVCVYPNRVLAVQTLLKNTPCDVVVTDDGLQHYSLARDFEIAVVDGKRLHGNRLCLPSGPLREPVARLESVDHVLFNRAEPTEDDQSFYLKPSDFYSLGGQQKLKGEFNGKTVHAVAGTASPERFFATLKSLGITPIEKVFPDHHAYTAEDFAAMKGQTILMTEKDAVKCFDFAMSDAWFLAVRAEIPEALKNKISAMLTSFYQES